MADPTYGIVVDTTADLPASVIQEFDFTILPIPYTIEGQTYTGTPEDSMDIHEFYDKMRGGSMPTTQQATPFTVAEAYEKLLSKGLDVLHICFSSALSGTYQSSLSAMEELKEKYPERTIISVDSLCASGGQGLLAYLTGKQRKNGATLQEAAAWAEENKMLLHHEFIVDDLNHLHRGGRVSKTAAVMGSLLGIKPVLYVDEGGRLTPRTKERGRAKAIGSMLKNIELHGIDLDQQTMIVTHGDCEKDALDVAQRLKDQFHVPKVLLNPIGPTIGAHSGPGTIAIFYVGDHR